MGIKKFLKSNTIILLSAFLVGCFSHYAVTKELKSSDNNQSSLKPLPTEVDDDFDKQVERIQKLHQDMIKDMDDSSFFSNTFKSQLDTNIRISQREDNDFKYIDIDASKLKKESLKVDIKEGMVTIQSEVKDTKKVEKDNNRSYSSFSSSFSQMINVPEGVDQNKAEIINQKSGSMTIKFPKFKFTS